jgi:hypothetical protein
MDFAVRLELTAFICTLFYVAIMGNCPVRVSADARMNAGQRASRVSLAQADMKNRADTGWDGIRAALLRQCGRRLLPYAARTVMRNFSTSALR